MMRTRPTRRASGWVRPRRVRSSARHPCLARASTAAGTGLIWPALYETDAGRGPQVGSPSHIARW